MRSSPAAIASSQLAYLAVGVTDADGVGVGVRVGVAVGVGVRVGLGVGVGRGVGVGVREIAGLGDGVGESEGRGVGLEVGAGVRAAVGVGVGVRRIIDPGVGVDVGVPDGVGVALGVGVGVGVGSTIIGSSSHASSIERSALTSSSSALSPQNTLTAIQSCAYWHHADSAGGFHSPGSRPPFERLLDAETAVNVCGNARSFAYA